MPRTASIHRRTSETDVTVSLDLDGVGKTDLHTGVGFFDHMLDLFGRHAMLDLTVKAQGDLHVDAHHTVEDVGLAMGQALFQALGDKKGICRYGSVNLPMDETLAIVAIDLSGRAFCRIEASYPSARVGDLDVELVEEFFKSLAAEAKLTLHVDVPRAGNAHHVAEAIFKGAAQALRQAVAPDPRQTGVPSTKGSL